MSQYGRYGQTLPAGYSTSSTSYSTSSSSYSSSSSSSTYSYNSTSIPHHPSNKSPYTGTPNPANLSGSHYGAADVTVAARYEEELALDRLMRPTPTVTAECTSSTTYFKGCGHADAVRTQRVAGCWNCALLPPCTPAKAIRIRVDGYCARCYADRGDGRDARGMYVRAGGYKDPYHDGLSQYVSEYGRGGGASADRPCSLGRYAGHS